MAIGKDKTQFPLILPKDLKAELEKRAEEEERSLSNYIVRILKQSLDTKKDGSN